MIEERYGRFLADGGERDLHLLAGDDSHAETPRKRVDRSHKTRDLPTKVSGLRRKTLVE